MAAQRFLTFYSRLKAAFPAIAFFGGFLWDALTLGRQIQSSNLWILLAYLTASGGLLIWMGRKGNLHRKIGEETEEMSSAVGSATDKEVARSADPDKPSEAEIKKFSFPGIVKMIREEGPTWSLQFCFGGMFSALVIFYFLSSSYLPGFFLVAGLAALLGLNEFLESHYHRFTLTWTLFGVCAILFLNFALPHVFHSIHPVWFYVSTALGLGLAFGIKALSPKARGSLWPLVGVACGLIALFIFNAIPPVPLVKKELIICRELEKKGPDYTAKIEQPPWFNFWRNSDRIVHEGEKVFCFTSVFLPSGIETTLYHRWLFEDPKKKNWIETSRVGFPIKGGRKEGYRGFSYKRNLTPGKWMVRVETEAGRVLGTIRFSAEPASGDTLQALKTLDLQ